MGNRFRAFRQGFGRAVGSAGRGIAAGAGMAGRGIAAAGRYGSNQASRAYGAAAPRIAAARNRTLTAVRNATIFRNSAANARALTILLRNGGVTNLKNHLPYSAVRARANTYLKNKQEQPLGAMTSACDVIHRVSRTLVKVNSPAANAKAANQIAKQAVGVANTTNAVAPMAPNSRQVQAAVANANKAAIRSVNAARQGNLPEAAGQLVQANKAAGVVVNAAANQMAGQAVEAAKVANTAAAVAPSQPTAAAASQAVVAANQAVVAARQGNLPVAAAAANKANGAATRAVNAAAVPRS